MSTVRLLRSGQLFAGVPYSYAATTNAPLIFTAGACPLDAEGSVVGLGDIRAQARQVMHNLETILAEAGATLGDVVQTVVYVASTQRAELVAAWDVVRERMGSHDAPSTLVGVTVLGWPGQVVEVQAIAAGGPA